MRNDRGAMAAAKGTSCKSKKITKIQTISKAKEVSLPASMTLEVAFVLPFFIFFFLNMMSMLNIIKVQSNLEAALHQTGSEIALVAAEISEGTGIILGNEDDQEFGILKSLGYGLYASKKIKEYLGDSIDNSCVSGGANGLHFYSSKIMQEGDIVDIVVDYKVHPIFPVVGFTEFPVQARFYGHAWTGYDIANGQFRNDAEEEMVYVTEHGTVYHRDISCKHLKLTISSVPVEEIGSKRNADGGKYYPCQYCKSVAGGNVFITPYGDRYHRSVNCKGLKRKIYTIPISEVGGRGPCSSCG